MSAIRDELDRIDINVSARTRGYLERAVVMTRVFRCSIRHSIDHLIATLATNDDYQTDTTKSSNQLICARMLLLLLLVMNTPEHQHAHELRS